MTAQETGPDYERLNAAIDTASLWFDRNHPDITAETTFRSSEQTGWKLSWRKLGDRRTLVAVPPAGEPIALRSAPVSIRLAVDAATLDALNVACAAALVQRAADVNRAAGRIESWVDFADRRSKP